LAAGVVNATPVARMSCVKALPSLSSLTLPTKAARAPKLATPAIVLAPEPPELSIAGPIEA
jgi:hypothetical protein